MNVNYKLIFALALTCIGFQSNALKAGNPERQGQAGAAQLTINGWARSGGLGWTAGGSINGAEAMFMNVGGLDRMANKTELVFARTEWLMGSGIGINNLGLALKLGEDGEAGSLGIQVMQFGIDPIEITTVENPHGGIGTYRVNMTNIGVAYSKTFSNSISAGVMARMVSEGIPDASVSGVALDAGVQYTTTLFPSRNASKRNDFKFGVSVKNIGPDMTFSGDGLSYKAVIQNGDFDKTMQVKTAGIKLPALLNIGASYDIRLDRDDNMYDNRLTVGIAFTNHAFSANQSTIALEYSYKDMLSLRGGFCYQEGIFSEDTRTSAFTGPFAGLSYDWHVNDENVISLDYNYRATNPFSGVHSFGVRIGLGSAE